MFSTQPGSQDNKKIPKKKIGVQNCLKLGGQEMSTIFIYIVEVYDSDRLSKVVQECLRVRDIRILKMI